MPWQKNERTRATEMEISHPFFPMNLSKKKRNRKVMKINPNWLKRTM
jgi:hypothetical protein